MKLNGNYIVANADAVASNVGAATLTVNLTGINRTYGDDISADDYKYNVEGMKYGETVVVNMSNVTDGGLNTTDNTKTNNVGSYTWDADFSTSNGNYIVAPQIPDGNSILPA